jgi:hypothetical protein
MSLELFVLNRDTEIGSKLADGDLTSKSHVPLTLNLVSNSSFYQSQIVVRDTHIFSVIFLMVI